MRKKKVIIAEKISPTGRMVSQRIYQDTLETDYQFMAKANEMKRSPLYKSVYMYEIREVYDEIQIEPESLLLKKQVQLTLAKANI